MSLNAENCSDQGFRLFVRLLYKFKESWYLKIFLGHRVILLLSKYLLRTFDYLDLFVFLFDKYVQLIQICSHLLHFLLSL